jgi:hypothetical protein
LHTKKYKYTISPPFPPFDCCFSIFAITKDVPVGMVPKLLPYRCKVEWWRRGASQSRKQANNERAITISIRLVVVAWFFARFAFWYTSRAITKDVPVGIAPKLLPYRRSIVGERLGASQNQKQANNEREITIYSWLVVLLLGFLRVLPFETHPGPKR